MENSIKYKIVEKIIQTNDERLLTEIKSLLGLSESDFWPDLPEDLKQAVNEAKAELDRDEGIGHSDVMKEMKDRFVGK